MPPVPPGASPCCLGLMIPLAISFVIHKQGWPTGPSFDPSYTRHGQQRQAECQLHLLGLKASWEGKGHTLGPAPCSQQPPPTTPTSFLVNSESAFLSFPGTWNWPGTEGLHIVFNLETANKAEPGKSIKYDS